MFVHLHCHSHYSFLRGVASPDEILTAAIEQNMPAVALTDTNGMYAVVPFYEKALDAGIKPLVGVTLDVEFRISSDEFRKSKFEIRNSASLPLTLLAMDVEGYSNLCRLTTLRHLGTTELACLPAPALPAGRRQADSDSLTQSAAAAETDGRPITIQELAEHSRGVCAVPPTSKAA